VYGFVRLRAASAGRGASRPRLVGGATSLGDIPIITVEWFGLAAL
jgi:hypothetical protein